MGRGTFWVCGGVWTLIMGGCGCGSWWRYILGGSEWVDIFHGWVGVGGHSLWVSGGIFWVGGCEWEWVGMVNIIKQNSITQNQYSKLTFL